MIVTCPACEARYLIDPRALGGGRTVRCTQCDHVWMQVPPEDAPRRVDLPLPGTPVPVAPAMARAMAATPVASPALTVPAIPTPGRAAAGPEELAYPDRPEASVARGSRGSVLLPLLVVLVVAALWFGRDTIAAYVPALDRAYAALGLSTGGDPRTDLEFRQVTSGRAQENGKPTLVISGEVTNISGNTRSVPPLRFTLEDAARHAIKSWTMVATSQRLRPGATVAFRTSIADPGDKGVGASVRFDADAN